MDGGPGTGNSSEKYKYSRFRSGGFRKNSGSGRAHYSPGHRSGSSDQYRPASGGYLYAGGSRRDEGQNRACTGGEAQGEPRECSSAAAGGSASSCADQYHSRLLHICHPELFSSDPSGPRLSDRGRGRAEDAEGQGPSGHAGGTVSACLRGRRSTGICGRRREKSGLCGRSGQRG